MTSKLSNLKKTLKRTVEENSEIDVKKAVEIASAYLSTVLGTDLIQLEEIEESVDSRYWLITISHLDKLKNKSNLSMRELLSYNKDRAYKELIINKKNGKVEKMKIKKINV